MWDFVGIVRTDKRLQRAQHRIDLLKQEVADYYANYTITDDLIELRNLLHVATLSCVPLCSDEKAGDYILTWITRGNRPLLMTILFPGS